MTCINSFRTVENLNQIFKMVEILKTTIPTEYTSGDFDCDLNLKDLCYYRLLVMGEYINKIYKTEPDVLLDQKGKDYWQPIIGLRNRLAHCYGEIDPYDIWDIMKYEFPDLVKELNAIAVNAECNLISKEHCDEEIKSLENFLILKKKLIKKSQFNANHSHARLCSE